LGKLIDTDGAAMTGSLQDIPVEKDSDMLRKQEAIMN
jgi:hypothetical protein